MSPSVTPGALLTLAAEVCDGSHAVPEMSQSRAACLMARQALEQTVDALLVEKRLACPAASMRARLIALSVAYADEPGDIGHRAATVWSRLSAACHHHAYELSPTLGEARALIHEVTCLDGCRTQRV